MMYQKILVPLDGSELAECVLPHVEAIAGGCRAAKIVLVRVVEPYRPTRGKAYYSLLPEESKEDWKWVEEGRSAAENYLKQVASRLAKGGRDVQTEVLVGRAAESLADFASKSAADLIVIATHGLSGITRWLWGSTADRVLRSSCVPVLMVRVPGCVPGI
jgi:nucleotide-binding universal stress UspA family protein